MKQLKLRWAVFGAGALVLLIVGLIRANSDVSSAHRELTPIATVVPNPSARDANASRASHPHNDRGGASATTHVESSTGTGAKPIQPAGSNLAYDLRADVTRLSDADPIGFATALRKTIEDDEVAGRLDAEASIRIDSALRATGANVKSQSGTQEVLKRVRCARGFCEIAFARPEQALSSPSELQRLVQSALAGGIDPEPVVYYRAGQRFDQANVIIFVFFSSAQLPQSQTGDTR